MNQKSKMYQSYFYIYPFGKFFPGSQNVASRPIRALCFALKPAYTVTEKCDSRRISPLSRRFRQQSHFSATLWTGL